MIWYWDHMSHPGLLNWFDTGIDVNINQYPFHSHAWRPCLLNLGFLCHMPSVPKNQVFCIGPLPPAEWAAQLSMWDGTVYWNLLCLWGVPSPAEKDSLCGTVMMAWIWHVWINAIVFVPTAKAPPKAGAKELSYNSLNLACSGQHPCFGPNWFVQFCHTWGWIGYA